MLCIFIFPFQNANMSKCILMESSLEGESGNLDLKPSSLTLGYSQVLGSQFPSFRITVLNLMMVRFHPSNVL